MKKLEWRKQTINGLFLSCQLVWIFLCTGLINFLCLELTNVLRMKEVAQHENTEIEWWVAIFIYLILLIMTSCSMFISIEKILTKKYRIMRSIK